MTVPRLQPILSSRENTAQFADQEATHVRFDPYQRAFRPIPARLSGGVRDRAGSRWHVSTVRYAPGSGSTLWSAQHDESFELDAPLTRKYRKSAEGRLIYAWNKLLGRRRGGYCGVCGECGVVHRVRQGASEGERRLCQGDAEKAAMEDGRGDCAEPRPLPGARVISPAYRESRLGGFSLGLRTACERG